jgi:hypothetical protein
VEDEDLFLEEYCLAIEHPGDHEGHQVSDGTPPRIHVLGRDVSPFPPAWGRALRDVMFMFTKFLLRWGLSRRVRVVRVGDVGEFVCFFPNVRWAHVAVNH